MKRRLAASPFGAWLRSRHDLKNLRSWSAVDDRRMAFYSNFVQAGDVAFDIGANLGNRTKILRRLGARVIALEPQPYCQGVLNRVYKNDTRVVILGAAVGREEGIAEMKLASGHVVSSLSPQWISEVTRSRRFGDMSWDRTLSCRITTLDLLIAAHGAPAFVKIDVEGYELEVIEGLSMPVAALSFEFTPECSATALSCIDRLDALGMVEFSYSDGESMELEGAWCGKAEIKARLGHITDTRSFGDVYVRMPRK